MGEHFRGSRWRPAASRVRHLPHDAVLDLDPTADAKPEHAYFPGGAFEYSKTIDVPAEWRNKRVSIVFEGVYRDAMVFVNGAFAAQRPYGYSAFTVSIDPFLRYGETNTIRVDARVHDDSRWSAVEASIEIRISTWQTSYTSPPAVWW
jgi:beta-galactosidase/beta-glucuronidase